MHNLISRFKTIKEIGLTASLIQHMTLVQIGLSIAFK